MCTLPWVDRHYHKLNFSSLHSLALAEAKVTLVRQGNRRYDRYTICERVIVYVQECKALQTYMYVKKLELEFERVGYLDTARFVKLLYVDSPLRQLRH